MSTFAICALFALGLLLTIEGGDKFVDGARWFAEATGIPKFIIAATLVSVATTMPELLVSSYAVSRGSNDMAIGNAIGSVACNTGLILGISFAVQPGATDRRDFLDKAILMFVAVGALGFFSRDGRIDYLESAIFFALLALFIWSNLRSIKKDEGDNAKTAVVNRKTVTANVLRFALGAAALVVGSRLLVNNGTKLAEMLGVPESVIAITLVALGTSLPELVTTITALAKKEYSMSVGNIIGANILDVVMIMPVCSIISGGSLPVSVPEIYVDVAASLLLIAVVILPAVLSNRFKRYQGVLLMAFYAAYLYIRIRYFGV